MLKLNALKVALKKRCCGYALRVMEMLTLVETIADFFFFEGECRRIRLGIN